MIETTDKRTEHRELSPWELAAIDVALRAYADDMNTVDTYFVRGDAAYDGPKGDLAVEHLTRLARVFSDAEQAELTIKPFGDSDPTLYATPPVRRRNRMTSPVRLTRSVDTW